MLSKCANPRCTTPFRYLHDGKLFRVEIPATTHNASSPAESARKPPWRTEYFWLCNACSARMTLVYENNSGVTTRPVPALRAGAGL